MALQLISRGNNPGDGLGESGFSGAGKINANFTELYQAISDILTILNSDDTNLDTLHEIVEFIQMNLGALKNLTISNIAGLQAALDAKLAAADFTTLDMPLGIDLPFFGLESTDSLTEFLAAVEDEFDEMATMLSTNDIVDNLTSTDTDKVLSANQGKVLDEKIEAQGVIIEELISENNAFSQKLYEWLPNQLVNTNVTDVHTLEVYMENNLVEAGQGKATYLYGYTGGSIYMYVKLNKGFYDAFIEQIKDATTIIFNAIIKINETASRNYQWSISVQDAIAATGVGIGIYSFIKIPATHIYNSYSDSSLTGMNYSIIRIEKILELNQLPEVTVVNSDDQLLINKYISQGVYELKKITFSDFLRSLP